MFGAYVVLGAGVAQLALGLLVQNAWWVPDLLLISLLAAVGTAGPQASAAPLLMGGALAMLFGGRAPLAAGVSYVSVGGVAMLAASRWDLSEERTQRVGVALAEACLLLLWMVADQMLTVRTLCWGIGRILLTVACLPWVRRVALR